jgi:hypothetical protein
MPSVKDALGELGAGFLVEGSAGAGNWAAVPWLSVFDPAITTAATHGYYVVYLFHGREPVVHLISPYCDMAQIAPGDGSEVAIRDAVIQSCYSFLVAHRVAL